jgi:hypothetical protein
MLFEDKYGTLWLSEEVNELNLWEIDSLELHAVDDYFEA